MELTRYRDVAAALRDPKMGIIGGSVDPKAHREMREQARLLYSQNRTVEFTAAASRLTFEGHKEVELVRDFAEPWALAVAALVTGLHINQTRALTQVAWKIFEPCEETPRATTELASRFPPQTAALHTQAFVALTVSLPAFLGNAWLALLENPEQMELINERTAIDELLRFAGPSLIQMRADNIELHLATANRDPEEFDEPNRLDLTRSNAQTHLAFGGGPHACVGGQLIKSATAAILPVFVERFRDARLLRSEPYGTRTIRGHRVYVI